MKLLLILLFCLTSLFSIENYELNLYEKILPAIFDKKKLDVYVDTETQELMKYSKVFNIVSTCREATILIGSKFTFLSQECLSKPLFSTSYRSFKTKVNSFGAFYWRKSRPQIKFKSKVLLKYNLILPSSLKRFSK